MTAHPPNLSQLLPVTGIYCNKFGVGVGER
jgi:hypothetical protein